MSSLCPALLLSLPIHTRMSKCVLQWKGGKRRRAFECFSFQDKKCSPEGPHCLAADLFFTEASFMGGRLTGANAELKKGVNRQWILQEVTENGQQCCFAHLCWLKFFDHAAPLLPKSAKKKNPSKSNQFSDELNLLLHFSKGAHAALLQPWTTFMSYFSEAFYPAALLNIPLPPAATPYPGNAFLSVSLLPNLLTNQTCSPFPYSHAQTISPISSLLGIDTV